MEVVILAGGKGRRFGGVKQFTPVAPDGATLLEVTVGDARRAGCDRAIIVTAPGCEDNVRSLFASRPVADCDIIVVTQRAEDLPTAAPVARDRPWGTAHALWAARDAVTGPFMLFNADDHYGPNAPAVLAAALGGDGPVPRFAMLAYPLNTTLSAAGTVSRAICETDRKGRLTAMYEYPAIDSEGRVVDGDDTGRALPPAAPVSMNAWAFTPDVFPLLETSLRDFLATADLAHDECFLPAVINAGVRSGEIMVRVVTAPDRWCGMTWPEDRRRVSRRLMDLAALYEAAEGFGLDVSRSAPTPFGAGLVNATWRLETAQGARLLQRLNAGIFCDPVAVAENAAAAATRIDDALRRQGDENPRHRLVFLTGAQDRPWMRDTQGGVWRYLVLVPDARPADAAIPSEVHAAARAFGRFPGLVTEGTGPELQEILPGFHDTPIRLIALHKAATTDVKDRLASCRHEYNRLVELAALADRIPAGSLPTRPGHNDAKLDNVLVDRTTGEALCVIDLDTAMPGFAPHDFGDLVRSAVTGRPEDEPDLEQVIVRRAIFHDLAAGYLEGSQGWLTRTERNCLVDGALVITYEQTLRFLTDHLTGDVYYRTDVPGHNLRRARAQLRLLEQLLATENDLRQIVNDI